MSKEELEGLSPEEKIKKLKELEEKKKKEIDEARKLLRESERELTDKEEFERKVPIPEIAKEDVSNATEEEKEILKTHRGLVGKKETEEIPEKTKSGTMEAEESLEEIAFREKAELPPEVMQSEYTEKLSQEPMQNLYREIKDIYQAVEDKGYISSEEQRKVQYLNAATERKIEDIESGEYSLTEEVARAAIVTRSIGASLKDMYKGKSSSYQR